MPHIRALSEEIKIKSGTAFLYEEKLKKEIRLCLEETAALHYRTFYEKIKAMAEDVRIDKCHRTSDDRKMLLNVSCLLNGLQVERLGDARRYYRAGRFFRSLYRAVAAVLSLSDLRSRANGTYQQIQITLTDVLDRLLDKGLIVNADIVISVAGIPLVGVVLRAAVAGMETMLAYGMMEN